MHTRAMARASRLCWSTKQAVIAVIVSGLLSGSIALTLYAGGLRHQGLALLLHRGQGPLSAGAKPPTAFEEIFDRYGSCGNWQEDYIRLQRDILAGDAPQRVLRVVGVQVGLTGECARTARCGTQRIVAVRKVCVG
jgi:hypothetical protein